MAVKCLLCKETVDKRRKSVGFLECVNLNCANFVHIDCTTLNPNYIAQYKDNFQCSKCTSANLTSKHVSKDQANVSAHSNISDISDKSDISKNLQSLSSGNLDDSVSNNESDSNSGLMTFDSCENLTCNTTRSLLLDRVSSLEKELTAIRNRDKIDNSKEILCQLLKISSSLEEVKSEVALLKKSNNSNMEAHHQNLSDLTKSKDMEETPPIKKIEPKKRNFSSNKIKMCEGNILKLPKNVAIAHCVAADLNMSDGLARHIKNKYKINTEELLKLNKKKGEIIHQKVGDTEILHLITKDVSYISPKWKDYKNTLKTIPKVCQENGINKLIVPKLGSGLDKIPWASTMKLLKNICNESNLQLIVLSLPNKDELNFKLGVKNKNLKKNLNKVDTKIKLLGDSHVKGLPEELLPLIPPTTLVDFSANGGATTEEVNRDLNIHTSDLTNNDVLVSITGAKGGSSDAAAAPATEKRKWTKRSGDVLSMTTRRRVIVIVEVTYFLIFSDPCLAYFFKYLQICV